MSKQKNPAGKLIPATHHETVLGRLYKLHLEPYQLAGCPDRCRGPHVFSLPAFAFGPCPALALFGEPRDFDGVRHAARKGLGRRLSPPRGSIGSWAG